MSTNKWESPWRDDSWWVKLALSRLEANNWHDQYTGLGYLMPRNVRPSIWRSGLETNVSAKDYLTGGMVRLVAAAPISSPSLREWVFRSYVGVIQAVIIFLSRRSQGVRPGSQRCSLPLRWYLTRLVLGIRYLQLTLGIRRGGFRTSLTLLGLLEELRGSIVE